ncbi:maintenance of telomere capping protein 1 [Clohesyomyces aquaticus]|uniref:Maintenance of telomere capping protein 1 n=1 Tax=Clohesyomyces aquaticus TaxID=1231657 RepID=A0A1Y1YFJ6_9PLEO|nr:maintenance of telomere capping protein 1 [Clohesyomyces aquaticus]
MEAEAPAPPPPKSSRAAKAKAPRKSAEQEDDALKELEELEALEKFQRPEPPRPTSRPNTPKLSSSTTSSNARRAGIATPSSTASARTSEEKAPPPRKSAESARSFHQGFAPPEEEPRKAAPAPEPKPSGGGWWGGLLSTATATADAARKRAEAAYQEIQKNEEALRWAEQVRGNVGALRGIGGELQKRALPTFTNILHTLAPPISQHERLQIHITHDLVGYPSLDPIIYQTFSTVMAQVEGGDLLVIQRGSESTHRRGSMDGYRGGSSGWNDGPWWRQNDKRDLSVVKGLPEGTKLCRVSAESYATDFFAAHGGVEEAAKQATEILSETNPVRSSDIFLSIQAISYEAPVELFGGASGSSETEKGGVQEHKDSDELVTFAIYIHDPIHSISFHALSQAFPAKWVEWLDATSVIGSDGVEAQLPQEIREIIESGGVDPREWVAEWMEETISLSVGIVAQRYVARRMGVGEGGIGRGKHREEALEAGGGEAARAGIL